jgi:hypothetical protein
VKIIGADASNFQLTNRNDLVGSLVNYSGSNWQVLPAIKFVPGDRVGGFDAQIQVFSDAIVLPIDTNFASIKGSAYSIGYSFVGCDFPMIFRNQVETVDKNTKKPAFVEFSNNGSSDITLTKNVAYDYTNNDYLQFHVDLSKPELQQDYVLKAGSKINLPVTFNPSEAGSFHTKLILEAVDNDGNPVVLNPAINGDARFMTTQVKAQVVDGDKIAPGEKRTVEVSLKTTDGQTLADANVRKFTVKMAYKPSMLNQTLFIAKPIIDQVSDITVTNTMTEGWNVELDKTIGKSDSVFAVTFTQPLDNAPLAASDGDIIFKFNIQSYFASAMDNAEYDPDITYVEYSVGDNYPVDKYLEYTTVNAPFSIKKVCMDNLREIVVGAVAELGKVNPNPAGSTVKFDYTVSFDNTQTSIVLYNSIGDEIVRIVDGPKEAGVHAVTLDIDALGIPNGTYYYRMVSDNFMQTLPLVIAR